MILSMTGFGRASAETSTKRITVEIKSLNSKQLDFTSRVPALIRDKEIEIRNIVAKTLQRGKVDISITIENLTADNSPTLNTVAIRAYKEQIVALSDELGIPLPEDWYATLLRFPDAIKNEAQTSLNEEENETLFRVLAQAVEALMKFRQNEGEKLETFFVEKIDKIKMHLTQIEPFEQERVQKIRNRIIDSLLKLQAVDYDRNRLEQELIYYIEKLDVNEEKQRLSHHLNHFIETLNAPFGQGKKLGFIAQEMGREINTLGSKSNQSDMQRIVVYMKDNLEQIKEQVLNVM